MDADVAWVWVQDYTGTSGSVYERFVFAASPLRPQEKCPRAQCGVGLASQAVTVLQCKTPFDVWTVSNHVKDCSTSVLCCANVNGSPCKLNSFLGSYT